MGRHAQGFRIRWRGVLAYVRFRHRGTRHELALGAFALAGGGRDRVAAQDAAERRYAEVVSGRLRPRLARLGVKVAPPFADLLASWLVAMRGSYDPETLKTWETYARKFVAHFGALAGVTEASVGDYTRARLRAVLRDTVGKERHALGVFVAWAVEQGYLAEAPPFPGIPKGATGVRSGTQRAKPVHVSPRDVARWLARLPERAARAQKRGGDRFPVRAYAEALWETGLRPATLQALSVPEHYAPGRATLTITDEIDKARFGRELPLTPGARAALDRVAPARGLIFGRHTWTKQFKRAAAAVGLPKEFAPYDLRHGRAVDMLEATGDDLLGVGYQLGHRRTTTTDRYLGKTKRAGERVVAALSGDVSGGRRRAGSRNQGDRRGSNPRQLEPQPTSPSGSSVNHAVAPSSLGADGRGYAATCAVSGDDPPILRGALAGPLTSDEWEAVDAFERARGAA